MTARSRPARNRKMTRFALLSLMLLVLALPARAAQMNDMGVVVLRTIDKVSARTGTFEVPVDKTVKFGDSLYIKARACRKAAATEKPESAAFLQIWERKSQDTESRWVFSGWMFASNPAMSAMDHPIYDVWVIDCKNSATSPSQEFSTEKTPAAAPDDAGADDDKPQPTLDNPED